MEHDVTTGPGGRQAEVEHGDTERVGSRLDVRSERFVSVGAHRTTAVYHQGVQEKGVGLGFEDGIENRAPEKASTPWPCPVGPVET